MAEIPSAAARYTFYREKVNGSHHTQPFEIQKTNVNSTIQRLRNTPASFLLYFLLKLLSNCVATRRESLLVEGEETLKATSSS